MIAPEKPLMFNTPMVRAILDDRKRKTRRGCKEAIKHNLTEVIDHGSGMFGNRAGDIMFRCPHGRVGELIWVKETYTIDRIYRDGLIDDGEIIYRASTPPSHCWPDFYDDLSPVKWKSSMFMPRRLSRITLRITSVHVERLQDITPDEAIAEGLSAFTKDGRFIKYGIPDYDWLPGNDDIGWPWQDWRMSPVDAFQKLWTDINGAESWAANPLVWVIGFERVT